MFEILLYISKITVRSTLSCCSEIRENCRWRTEVSKIQNFISVSQHVDRFENTFCFFSSHIQITTVQGIVNLASLDSVCCVSLHLSLVPGAPEGVYYKWMFNVCLEEVLVWLGFSGCSALETAADGEGPCWALSGNRETLLHLVAGFGDGFLVILVVSSFGRGELGEEMIPIILFDLLHCQWSPGAGVCWLGWAVGQGGWRRARTHVALGESRTHSKKGLRMKSSWWAKRFVCLPCSWD